MSETTTPQIRVAATERALSSLIIDGDQRVLLLNANGPQDARAALGTLQRPWESNPSTVIVGADRGNVEALWEALQRLQPRQLIVAGAPGANPDWITVERFCRDTGIDISYIDRETELVMPSIVLTVAPPHSDERAPSHVKLQVGEVRVALALGGLSGASRLHLAIASAPAARGSWSDVRITADQGEDADGSRAIYLDPGERIDVHLEPERIRIQGAPARGVGQP